jgi:hypothetical protein
MKASSLISTNIFSLFQILKTERVSRKRCLGILVIPDLREMTNIER